MRLYFLMFITAVCFLLPFSIISQKNKKLLVIQEEYVVFQSFSFSHLTVIGPTENPPNIHFLLEIVFSSQYDIVGHSGDSPEIPFVSHDAPPKNNKERLDIMKQMHAHAQYCWSGDHTLEATDLAISRITEQEADDYFVVVLSDANLERYGIPAEAFGKALTSDARVNAFAIFIGSLGNQADR